MTDTPFELRLGVEEALAEVPGARERMQLLDLGAELRSLPERARVRWLMLSPGARELVLLVVSYAVLLVFGIVKAHLGVEE